MFFVPAQSPQRLPLTVGGIFAAAVQLVARLSIKTDVTRFDD
jgi:hypothetical protein